MEKAQHEPFLVSPLKINQYYIKEISCSVKPTFEDRFDKVTTSNFPKLQAEVSESNSVDNHREWRFELRVESIDDPSLDAPYSIRIVVVGFFEVREEYPQEHSDTLARVNGPSLLYSAAREALLSITGRTGFPPILLPSIRFNPLPLDSTALNPKSLKSGGVVPSKNKPKIAKKPARKTAKK